MIEDFIKIFSGFDLDFGKADMSNIEVDTERNKVKPRYEWAGRNINTQDYQLHLNGKISIGIQPCRIDRKASFGCIDIDPKNYSEFKIETYLAYFQQYGLPLIPCLSKSGGLHCYIFLKEPVPASDLREALQSFLLPLKLDPKTEVFPKQSKLEKIGDQYSPGNFINLPYFNCKKTSRYAVDKNNHKLSLEQFIELVKNSRIDGKALDSLVEESRRKILLGADPEFNDGPPCLGCLSKTKLDDGRDRFLYNYMVFAKKKYKEEWEDKVMEANTKYFEQPFSNEKLQKKLKAWRKETASHTCHENPIAPVCQRTLCASRTFGIRSDSNVAFPMISDFEIILGNPRRYHFNIEAQDGKLKPAVVRDKNIFCKQEQFAALCWEVAGFYPERLKFNDFIAKINGMRASAMEVKPAAGTSDVDKLYNHLYEFCVNSSQAKQKIQIRSGSCYTDKGFHFFKFQSFYDSLGNRWKFSEEETAYIMKKEFGAIFNHSFNIDGKTEKVIKIKQLHVDQIEYKPIKREGDNF